MSNRNHITGAVQEDDPFTSLWKQCLDEGMTKEELMEAVHGYRRHTSQEPESVGERADRRWAQRFGQ